LPNHLNASSLIKGFQTVPRTWLGRCGLGDLKLTNRRHKLPSLIDRFWNCRKNINFFMPKLEVEKIIIFKTCILLTLVLGQAMCRQIHLVYRARATKANTLYLKLHLQLVCSLVYLWNTKGPCTVAILLPYSLPQGIIH
jgi:hypothetical protein